ncbi:MAG TPA: protocatechuate 3,4-dioxygenase [Hyphomicrobiaceae bacterium]|nr:protocatechuate 3,4-dioxygenase [Hyphomicrobiaceae bacterium]
MQWSFVLFAPLHFLGHPCIVSGLGMTHVKTPWLGRRTVITGMSISATALLLPAASLAQVKLIATPRQTEGPFYPVEWNGDVDADLVQVRGEAAQAMGQIAHVGGRIIDVSSQPIAGAIVEIWQCDANGIYRHPHDGGGARSRDRRFQGRGRAISDASGRYSFRTIRPVAYPGRAPHIHFKVVLPDRRVLVTQMYIFGEAQNERDGVLNSIRDQRQRDRVVVRLVAADGIEARALTGTFDIVVG